MNITLPSKLLTIVQKNNDINGKLLILMNCFSEWLSANNMEFFPEYTDHGISHVQSVINTAESLITDQALELITPEDVYVLTTSILLHDCAMHLSKDALWNLLSNDTYNGVLFLFDNEDEWISRWNKFNSDVKKFDEQDWHKFFNENRIVELPEIGCKSLNDDQRIIIGDFIRKYHACIAQVIATYGFPSVNGPIDIFNNELSYLNQLSGVVARSHNHRLRYIVDLLGEEKKREYRKTHPTYIMGLIRLADYLQFKEDRTPKFLFKTKGFCSPISIKEWKKHLSIISTNDSHPDEELIFVEAFPEDASTLISIKNLLEGLQKELDEFWATTGEVYSRYPKIRNLSIIYRRVKSNIDNPKKYVLENHKTYHPELLSIKSDNQKLFPLLIKPLYGNHPQIGIRELLQNAIDACNERFCLESGMNVIDHDIPYPISVTINVDNSTLTIEDSGVGMSIEIIKNYFLKIGSSYRTSEFWKSVYTDNDNNSHIPRTGKFGIGMLAGFLIGNKIDVLTKHVDEKSKAVKFNYSIDSDEIELSYSTKDKIGTEITIHSDKKTLEIIKDSFIKEPKRKRYYSDDEAISSWWYYMDTPEIATKYINDGKSDDIQRHKTINKSSLNESWNKVEDTELELFLWSFGNRYQSGETYCNGIYIHEQKSPIVTLSLGGLDDIEIHNIDICVFDNHGIFPLALTRDKLATSKYFEHDKLQNSFKKHFVKELISISEKVKYDREELSKFINTYSYSRYNSNKHIPLVFCKDGVKPFSCKSLFNNSVLIFVDFVMHSQKRGIIYDNDVFSTLDGMPYSCLIECDKYQDTVEKAIAYYIFNKRKQRSRGTDEDNKENLNIELESWVFIKKYDFNKLSDHYKTTISNETYHIYEMDENWIVITNIESRKNIPHQGLNIINTKSRNEFFMFSIYKQKTQLETEISEYWSESK
ncbi:HD domain-containing protein [Photobacterium lipolyticum]|uniref:HD-CE domain-containing protein n=1 Tax=Photobacterium lipolyticum TaxID=266810 RepID=A0A2T3N1L6_9GAMM|nr:ATP-binding protein [Photobacterium lipolyticum]PSW06168.1 hypothetical protein C9I89_06570 [Photobacterium lipolyticum]